MESTEDSDEAKSEQPPNPIATPEHTGAGDEDLISGLCDDVLLRILGLVAQDDAWDAVPMGEVSRRFRGLWKRVPTLCFNSALRRDHWKAERCIAFIDDALTFRAESGDSAEHLDIMLTLEDESLDDREEAVLPTLVAAEKWIWYAMQHKVKSFSLDLVLLPLVGVRFFYRDTDDDDGEERRDGWPAIALDELPGSTMLETLYLALDDARVRLPTTAVFPSLVDLTLEDIVVEDGSGRLLARLVSSSCCPWLQKLSLRHIKHDGVKDLLIDAGKLSDLTLMFMHEVRSLKLVTPCLRVLRIECCRGIKKLTVSAPRLDELITRLYHHQPLFTDIDGNLSSASRLRIALWSHACSDDDRNNNSLGLCLLQRCKLAKCLDVCLYVPCQEKSSNTDIIKDRLPQLPQITYLKLYISPGWMWHSLGDCLANILAKFTNLIYLSIDFSSRRLGVLPIGVMLFNKEWSDSLCNHWKSLEFSSAHLEEVKFKGVKGTDCELRFLQSVLAGATKLRKVILSFRHRKNQLEDFPQSLLGHGIWSDNGGDYYWSCEWRPC